MFDSVLVANRGEIAVRVIRTVQRLGMRAVAVHSVADSGAMHVRLADQAVEIGPADPAQSYRDIDRVLAAARDTRAQAVHPGYGFLSENPAFARAVTAAGLTWVGPTPESIEAMGDKVAARNLMSDAGVPVAPGSRTAVVDLDAAVAEAAVVGYPLMVKASAGGGGIGMTVVADEAALRAAFDGARTRAERVFGSPAILLERFVPAARHVEVQLLGLADGRVVALGERDCSVQRRHQKVAEETPSPGVDDRLRSRMLAAALRAGEAIGYRGAGTVEFLVDVQGDSDFFFLEMNTRLQVEHPVTELVTGLDLVEEQLRIAGGQPPTFGAVPPVTRGHALELRVCAEDPRRFIPSPGPIRVWEQPSGEGIRVDAGYAAGDTVSQYYDSLMAKLCIWAPDRETALRRAAEAVEAFVIEGPKTNLPFFTELLADPGFARGSYDTGLIDRMRA
ncbi:MAG: biotin carboxylase N-terminal domain-containing protein [Pseudonocardiales bacterium]